MLLILREHVWLWMVEHLLCDWRKDEVRIKVTDYIAEFLVDCGVNQVFTVVGGGAMHLNDSFGHHKKLNCTYCHHEQGAAISAEAYARVHNVPAVVCVTSGPGAINALNGVVGAYQDSIPMLIVSGQTKRELLAKENGVELRTLGNQEFDIVSALGHMTKYAETVMCPEKIRYHLEKAYNLAINGRPGPCWIDIPLDVQGTYVESEDLEGYNDEIGDNNSIRIQKSDLREALQLIREKLVQAKRPVFYAGNGIRLAGAKQELDRFIEKVKIPVVTCWNSIDLIATEETYYCGRAGIMGDRAGNFAVQNSDFLLCIGTRLNIYQVGYQFKTWAREAYTVVVDVDERELKKPTVHIDVPICADAKVILELLNDIFEEENVAEKFSWIQQCEIWKNKYPVVTKFHYEKKGLTNIYAFMDCLSRFLTEDMITVVTNGSASVVGSQSYYIYQKSRFIMNCALSSMGYGLPAAIGACIANGRKSLVCIEGDGSLMMNLQELQTLVTNQLPIKLFIINNDGYHQIRQTQNHIFHNGLVGVGPESHDLGFPNYEKIAGAFEIPYLCIHSNEEMLGIIQEVFQTQSYAICEVFVSIEQNFEPKSSSKRLEDGTIASPPLEDMYPFLPREELQENMYIPIIDRDFG